MKRGSALKWAEALDKANVEYDNSQLGFTVNDVTYASPLGVLANFLDPNGWSFGGFPEKWNGEVFKLPDNWAKSVKMKKTSFEIYDFFDEETYFYGNPIPMHFSWAAWLVRNNYEIL